MTECECPNIYKKMDFPIESIVKKITNVKRFIVNEFVYGGHILALGSSFVAVSTMILFNFAIRWEFLPIIYLMTLCIYNFDHFKELETDLSNNSGRVNHLLKYKKLLPFLIAFYGVVSIVLLLVFGNLQSIFFGIIFLSMGLVYSYKVKEFTSKILAFKNFYTASAVALSVFFTVIYCGYGVSYLFLTIFIFLFLRFLINTSFCDIKDMDTDKKQGLLTLPLYFGKSKFLILLHLINFLSFIVLLFSIIMNIIPVSASFLLVVNLYCFYYIEKSKNPETNISALSDIIVDGEFIFWPIFLITGKFFFMLL
jgi:4-hydroxybenzoate polyprenyltransferase